MHMLGDRQQSNSEYNKNETKYHYYDGIKQPANFIEYIENIPNENTLLKNEIWYSFDMFGNVISKKLKAQVDGASKERTIEYEYKDDLLYEGRFLTAEIIKASIPEEDIINRYDYYLASGLLKSVMGDDKNKLTTSYEYDKFDNLIKTNNPDLTTQVTMFEWANSGNCEITPPDSTFYYTLDFQTNTSGKKLYKQFNFFDKYGRTICKAKFGLGGDINAISFVHDGFGRQYKTYEPYNYSTGPTSFNTVQYDLLGRTISENLATGVNITTSYMGRTTKETNQSTGIWKEFTINTAGLVDTIKEPNSRVIDYSYYASGKVHSINSQGSFTSYDFDEAGNPVKIIDPDAGTTINTYNAFGELKTKTDDKHAEFMFLYDEIGRLVTIDNITDNETTKIIYIKNKEINGFGKIGKVEKTSLNGSISTTYIYDNLNRLSTRSESIDGKTFDFTNDYDPVTGKIFSYKYPSGLKLLYLFDEFGYLNIIKTESSEQVIWAAVDANPREQLTNLMYGGNMIVSNEFDSRGYLKRISTTKLSKSVEEIIQDLRFNFDPLSGNLMDRTDEVKHLKEVFTYDNELKSMLKSWEVGSEKYTTDYEPNGNIKFKSDVTAINGIYSYKIDKIHQVEKITNSTPEYLRTVKVQNITYTGFNKVKTINQQIGSLDVELKLTYGTDYSRIKSVLSNRGTPLETTYYLGDYETKKSGSGPEVQLHYLYATDGLFAIVEKDATTENLYYILKDHQGSFNQITDESGKTVELLSFDPWGRRRNPLTWSYTNAPTTSKFSRGYTGHEHLDNFGLINMNGRMYDPNLGRFLSPDPILQNPGSTQGHNRYSYVLNNPLKYTDPSGYYVKKAECRKEEYYNYGYINFGRKGGSLSDGYWANSYRSTGANWSVMSSSTFDNLYGEGKYNQFLGINQIQFALNNITADDKVYTWNSNSGVNLYMVNYNGNLSLISCLDNLRYYSVGTDNGLTFFNKNGNRAGLTSLVLYESTSTPISWASSVDWNGVINATLSTVSGVEEILLGVAAEAYSAGVTTSISVPLVVDGTYRVGANIARLVGYLSHNNKFSNAMPGNIGAAFGKGIDMLSGVPIDGYGYGQGLLGLTNDFTSFIATGGTAGSMNYFANNPSWINGLRYAGSYGGYPNALFYDVYPLKK